MSAPVKTGPVTPDDPAYVQWTAQQGADKPVPELIYKPGQVLAASELPHMHPVGEFVQTPPPFAALVDDDATEAGNAAKQKLARWNEKQFLSQDKEGNGGWSLPEGVSPPEKSKPTISGIDPVKGPADQRTDVTINGTKFAKGARVTFGGNRAVVTSVTETKIVCTAPTGTGTVDVTVTNLDGGTVTKAGAFGYEKPAPPKPTKPNPPTGFSCTMSTPEPTWVVTCGWKAPADNGVTITKYEVHVVKGEIEGPEPEADIWAIVPAGELTVDIDVDKAQENGWAPSAGKHTVAVRAVAADGTKSDLSNTGTVTFA